MKTYVVNMEKDTQKRELITSQLKHHPELDWQIWKAVEGRKMSDEEQKNRISPDFFSRYGRYATLPAVGCSLSHIEIYLDMMANDVKYSLILEDDAILPKSLNIEPLIELLDSDAPVAILLTPEFWYRNIDKKMDVDEAHSCFSLNDGLMTSGYMINKAACNLLVPKIYPVQYTADSWRKFVEFGLKLYGVVPHVISYPDGLGEIGRSQHVHKTICEQVRAVVVYFYIKLLCGVKYIKGNRKSKKKWN